MPSETCLYYFAHHALRLPIFARPGLVDVLVTDPAATRAWVGAAAGAAVKVCGVAAEQAPALAESVIAHRTSIRGNQAVVLELPEPLQATECYFIAAFRQGDGLIRYCTLERSQLPDRPLLCEWSKDGHALLGPGGSTALEPFLAAVHQAMKEEDEDSALADFLASKDLK